MRVPVSFDVQAPAPVVPVPVGLTDLSVLVGKTITAAWFTGVSSNVALTLSDGSRVTFTQAGTILHQRLSLRAADRSGHKRQNRA